LLKKNTEDVVVASKETCVGVNAEKFKYTWSLPEIRMKKKQPEHKTHNESFGNLEQAICTY
jgi:hypothetical protein